MNNQAIKKLDKTSFGITVSNPLQETKVDHYTKKLNRIIEGTMCDYNNSIYPSEWSRLQHSEMSAFDSPVRSTARGISQLHAKIPTVDSSCYNNNNGEDTRPFKPFANFNKPVTLFQMKKYS